MRIPIEMELPSTIRLLRYELAIHSIYSIDTTLLGTCALYAHMQDGVLRGMNKIILGIIAAQTWTLFLGARSNILLVFRHGIPLEEMVGGIVGPPKFPCHA